MAVLTQSQLQQILRQAGWQKHHNRREFWHYQFDEGLTWDQAMAELKV